MARSFPQPSRERVRAAPEEHARARPENGPAELSGAQARALVERLPAIVYVSDAGVAGRWHYISGQVEAILGFTPEQWLADPHLWAKRIHPEDRERVYARESQLDEPTAPEEYRMLHRDGHTVWVRDHATLLADGLGRLRWHGVLSDITDRKLAEAERNSVEENMRHQALHDSLTGLPNRALIFDQLERARPRPGRQLAVLLLDLDRFKFVNDGFGHASGDALLVEIAPRLSEALRPNDTVGRLGGDEFVVLLADIADKRVATEVAERIGAALRRPFRLEGTEHFVTVSIGIAFAGGERVAPDALIRDADAALYRAKERGRGRYEVFDSALRVRALERLALENDLRRALDRDELHVRYQPVVSLRDGTLASVEALVYWEHPQRGLVEPANFIPVAEDSGLIAPIGEWVLRESCRQACAWHAANPDAPPLGVSVNLSARQIVQRDLPGTVARALRDTGLDPRALCLEITESAILDDAGTADRTLRALLSLGVGLVLDDFGTGYSSLSYLTRLPIEGLKIDRSFVEQLGAGERPTAIVTAIVRMAQALSMGVTGEGVETARQLHDLRRLGCDRAQGFHISQPLAPEEISELLRRPGRLV
jgi:diguanylate cyclase (GGDEF)-like protein/PAS domain S-box-containing protein